MSLESSTSPRTYRFVLADILTSGYRVAGKMSVTAHGAMGFLNDPTHSTLEIHDARMGSHAQQGTFHLAYIGVLVAEIREQSDDRMHKPSLYDQVSTLSRSAPESC